MVVSLCFQVVNLCHRLTPYTVRYSCRTMPNDRVLQRNAPLFPWLVLSGPFHSFQQSPNGTTREDNNSPQMLGSTRESTALYCDELATSSSRFELLSACVKTK